VAGAAPRPAGIDAETQLLPVNGTREALFAIAQTCVGHAAGPRRLPQSLLPDLRGSSAARRGHVALFLDTTRRQRLSARPGDARRGALGGDGPAVSVHAGQSHAARSWTAAAQRFIEKALAHDVLLVSDECYSELYPDENRSRQPASWPPAKLGMGNDSYRNCLSMHSLSKRSNLPGLRSGFAAGDAGDNRALSPLPELPRLRHAPAPPGASIVAWSDEAARGRKSRPLPGEVCPCQRKRLKPLLDFPAPAGGFYLWPHTPIDDEEFARELYRRAGRRGAAGELPGTGA
jgi:N-succinyldiaminopimelate aminotransferase